MATKNYSILTNRGKALEAASAAGGLPVILKKFVVGDGNGQATTPDAAQTGLANEVYRGAISLLDVSPDQKNQFIAYLVLPEGVGNFTVREVGLLTDKDELYALGSCAAIEKPVNGVTVTLQFRLAVSESAQITLQTSTGDGLFLRQDANLSDVRDKARAIEHLGLKPTVDKAAGAVQKDQNGADIPDPELFVENLGLVETINKAAGAVQRAGDTMTGKLTLPQTSAFGVNTDNALGGNSITLGDNDTGIKQNGDGVLDVYANSQHVFRFVAGIINSLRSLRIEGYITATGGVYEANGNDNVRVYSPNNPPPAPNLSAYATRDWVLQNTVQDIDHTAPIEVQFWDGAGYPRGTDGAAMHNISFVGGYSNVGWIQFRYTRKRVNGTWYTIA